MTSKKEFHSNDEDALSLHLPVDLLKRLSSYQKDYQLNSAEAAIKLLERELETYENRLSLDLSPNSDEKKRCAIRMSEVLLNRVKRYSTYTNAANNHEAMLQLLRDEIDEFESGKLNLYETSENINTANYTKKEMINLFLLNDFLKRLNRYMYEFKMNRSEAVIYILEKRISRWEKEIDIDSHFHTEADQLSLSV
ncbi:MULTISPECIES: hypothetical protein [Pseudobacillus]|uniref:hypothetical protein n=1 Tax=Pseudobacillus TaxID=108525 RepID=UPI003879E71C